ncbi:MAG TPA: 5-formyltetrahydrofolate cyclo-ligase [Phycisphaerales bacterium]
MSDPLEHDKRLARAELKAALATIRPQLGAISRAVCTQIAAQHWWIDARVVMLFAPMPDEIDLLPLATDAISAGKRVCVPRVGWATSGMTPVALQRGPGDLVTGRHGVPEPRSGLTAVPAAELDVILAPGLGFDISGHRLGRGAGFYDRFLRSPGVRAVVAGVCPEALLRDAIPVGATDAPVRFLVTERRILSCGGS